MGKISFSIVGGGWRALFYLRVAKALPDLFAIEGMVVRDRAKGEALEREWGVRTHRDIESLARTARPRFLVTSVSWAANPGIILELVDRGIPVLSETPPAPDIGGLRDLVARVRASRGRVQVAEEYHLRPLHLAQMELVRRGTVGTVRHANVSVGHGYHGISLVRRFLGVGLEPARVHAFRFDYPVVKGPDRDGPPKSEEIVDEKQELFIFQFSEGRVGVVDFAESQYFGWIRPDRLLARGERGQIDWDDVRFLKDFATPLHVPIERVESGRYGDLAPSLLQGFRFGDSWLWRNRYPAPLMDDEIALCELLSRMAAYVDGGPEPYPLVEGAHDHFLYLKAQESAAGGASEVAASPAEWGEA